MTTQYSNHSEKSSAKFTRLTPEQAREKLLKKYILLPVGSYFKWIEPKWFEKYKLVLSFKNGAWIPNSNHLQELEYLDKEYTSYKNKEAYAEAKEKEYQQSLFKETEAKP